MKITFSEIAWEHYLFWQENDLTILRKVNKLIKDIKRSPYNGIVKPESLKGNLRQYWSRRINKEHRIVYTIKDEKVFIAKCRFHYEK